MCIRCSSAGVSYGDRTLMQDTALPEPHSDSFEHLHHYRLFPVSSGSGMSPPQSRNKPALPRESALAAKVRERRARPDLGHIKAMVDPYPFLVSALMILRLSAFKFAGTIKTTEQRFLPSRTAFPGHAESRCGPRPGRSE